MTTSAGRPANAQVMLDKIPNDGRFEIKVSHRNPAVTSEEETINSAKTSAFITALAKQVDSPDSTSQKADAEKAPKEPGEGGKTKDGAEGGPAATNLVSSSL